ncbi:MAG: AI-2E family transporter [Thermococcus sp.]|nr:AI-2E family transporter [Thermococcus sp.]
MRGETIVWAAVILGIIYISWEVTRPFVSAIFFGVVLAYAVYPLQKRLEKKLSSSASALLLSGMMIGLGGGITAGLLIISAQVASSFYRGVVDFIDWLLQQPLPPEVIKFITDFSDQLIPKLSDALSRQAFSIPSYLLQLLVFLFTFYYSLAYAEEIVGKIRASLPEKNRELGEKLLESMNKTLSALVRAWLLLNVAKGFLMTLGFLIFGVSDLYTAIVAGFLTFIFSFVPLFEGWMIWLIAAGYFVLHGMYGHAIGISIYGFLLVSPMPDYTIRPLMVAKDTELDETLVFLGMVGGTWAMGLKGLIIGPIVLNLLLVLLKEWKKITAEREPLHPPSPSPSEPQARPPSLSP